MTRVGLALGALVAAGWLTSTIGSPTAAVRWSRITAPVVGPLLWYRCHQGLAQGRPREALAWAAQATETTDRPEPGRRFMAWICAWNLAEDAAGDAAAAAWVEEGLALLGPPEGREPATDEVAAVIWLDRILGDEALTRHFGREEATRRGRAALERAELGGSRAAAAALASLAQAGGG